MQIFTHVQRTQKNYTVGQAYQQAVAVVHAKNPRLGICTDALKRHEMTDCITLERMSNLVEAVVGDSFYYNWEIN